jgi:uncharacterized membrane protein
MKKIIFITVLCVATLSNKSYSQVTVENATNKTIIICIGWIDLHETSSQVFSKSWSEGWWTIEPGQKSTIKSVCPSERNIFYYAKSTDGETIWEGSQNEYGIGSVPAYFRVSSEVFKIVNPEYDTNIKYPSNYWKIFRKKNVNKGNLFTSPSVNIYLTL